MIERGAEAAMVVILNGHEAERLQHAFRGLLHRAEDFGHGMDRACLRLKRDLYKIALSQTMGHAQQTSGHGNGLEFCFSAAAVL
jgi:hypothetical protein